MSEEIPYQIRAFSVVFHQEALSYPCITDVNVVYSSCSVTLRIVELLMCKIFMMDISHLVIFAFVGHCCYCWFDISVGHRWKIEKQLYWWLGLDAAKASCILLLLCWYVFSTRATFNCYEDYIDAVVPSIMYYFNCKPRL